MALDDMDPRNPQRPRGALTEADREYLLHREVGKSKHAESVKRHRIRKRTRQSIVDLSLVHNHMQREDVSMVFDLDVEKSQKLEECIIDAIAFLYLGTDNFEDSIEEALHRAVDQYGSFEKGDLHVSIGYLPDKTDLTVDEAIEMFEQKEDSQIKIIKPFVVEFQEELTDQQRERLENIDHEGADMMLEQAGYLGFDRVDGEEDYSLSIQIGKQI